MRIALVIISSLFFSLQATAQVDTTVYDNVEQPPEFNGNILTYFIDKLNVTDKCAEDYEARIIAEFVVEANGAITQPRVIKGLPTESCRNQFLNLLTAMPAWKPGRQNDIPVRVRYSFPLILHFER